MSVAICRTAEPNDVAALATLMARTFRDTYREDRFGDCRVADVEAYVADHLGPAHLAAEMVDDTAQTIVAEVEGALAGYVQLRAPSATAVRDGSRPVEIARLYVDRPWHGRGVAQALLDAVRRAAPDADPLWLSVYERNPRARAFYAKSGFVVAGRATFVMGDDVQHDWIMVLDAGLVRSGAPFPA